MGKYFGDSYQIHEGMQLVFRDIEDIKEDSRNRLLRIPWNTDMKELLDIIIVVDRNMMNNDHSLCYIHSPSGKHANNGRGWMINKDMVKPKEK